MRELDAVRWEGEVLGADRPVIVDFWAPWCGPCRAIRPILEELEQRSGGRVAFAGLDVDRYPEVAARYDVLSIPTVIVFSEGTARRTVVGARPRSYFERLLEPWLGEPGR